MVNIYGTTIDQMTEETFDYFLRFLTREKQQRITRFRFFDDAKRSLLGEILTRYAIFKDCNATMEQMKFDITMDGKPILQEPSGLHFNISHSGNWVVCAIDDEPIGVDVEAMKPINYDIGERFFAPKEYCDLINMEEGQRKKYFYMLWTLKESYIKAIGKGLAIPLDSFCFTVENGNIMLYQNNEARQYYFWQHEIDIEHILSVCAVKPIINGSIEVVELSQLNYKMALAQ